MVLSFYISRFIALVPTSLKISTPLSYFNTAVDLILLLGYNRLQFLYNDMN